MSETSSPILNNGDLKVSCKFIFRILVTGESKVRLGSCKVNRGQIEVISIRPVLLKLIIFYYFGIFFIKITKIIN